MDASNSRELYDPLPPPPPPPDLWQPAEKTSIELRDYSRDQNTPVPMDIATTPSPVPPPTRNCQKSEYSKLFREVQAAAKRRPEHLGETWKEIREKTRIAWTRLLAFESKKKGLDYLDGIVDKKIDKKFPNWRDPNFKPPVRSRSSSREPRKDGSDGVIQKGEFRRHSELSRRGPIARRLPFAPARYVSSSNQRQAQKGQYRSRSRHRFSADTRKNKRKPTGYN
ncbi:hypothetical protein GCK72_023082 [Caenorhabditis remanei]|uniref:Uncharacterized protein n=1 Tax=Caenorhabditis remanei TaxID=31234 RepID=A0A6A5FVT2_CAERE|nr:hypothetical protein GCK72_023082 [Caenorhabditis remanei]KAF1746625.1 hypothetical protein GCK72_023082 [Caenorhabditis remanei]